MRAVVQRVSSAQVTVDGRVVGAIGPGLLVLVGMFVDDQQSDVEAVAGKIATLRIFRDGHGKMNQSVADVGGSVLVVSQFTLAADVRKGRRPSFVRAAPPEVAAPFVEEFCKQLASSGMLVEQGVFGADMSVSLTNDGPVTVVIDSRDGSIV